MNQAGERIGASAWWLALPFLAAVAAYAPAINGGFVWDDHLLIVDHPLVRELVSVDRYFGRRFWSDPFDSSDSFYRPLVTLSYAVEWKLWSGSAAGFHLTNVLAHLGVTALVLALCLRAGARGLSAAIPAALFATLPRLTESVAWISGRTDVFASLFGLSALLVYRPSVKGFARPLATGALLGAALLCKEVAFAFLFALVLLEWRERTRFTRESLRWLAPSFAAAGIVLALRAVTASSKASLGSSFAPSGIDRVVAVFASTGTYARMLVDPLRPSVQIGYVTQPSVVMALIGVLVLAAATWLVFKRRARLSTIQVAFIGAFALSLAMVVHIFPLHMPVIAADRFLYVPAASAAIALAMPLSSWAARWPRPVAIVSVVAVALFAARAHARVLVWNDEYSLWKSAVEERDPRNTGPLLALAGVLLDASLPERALVHLERQLEGEGSNRSLKTWSTYAVALSKAGQHQKAVEILEGIARAQSAALRARLNLPMAYARAGRWDDAANALEALSLQKDIAAQVSAVSRQLTEARARMTAAQAKTGVERLVDSASVLDELGSAVDAEKTWREVLRSPDANAEQRQRAMGQLAFFGEPARVVADLEWLRAQSPGVDLSEFERAVKERDALR